MEKFKDRLNFAIKHRKISAAELARLSKVNEGAISQYRKGAYKATQENLERLAKALNVSIPWLMGADVPISPDKAAVMAKMGLIPPEITKDVTEFPIIGEIAAGFENIAAEDWTGETIEIPNKYLKGYKKTDFFVLRVKGQSMYPIYQEDDVVLILKQSTVNQSGDIGVIVYGDECATLKKLEFIKGEDWLRMIPLNPEYVPRLIEGEDLEHCCVLGIPKLLIREIN